MATTVQRLGAITNLVHGFIYFSTEATAQYRELGLKGRQQYFAGRAAAMGPVGPGLVVATFYNFNPAVVHEAIPSAWQAASAIDVQAARFRAVDTELTHACPDLDPAAIEQASLLAQAMVHGVGDEGKPLAAANRGVELPDDPRLRLWQLITIIREWRGDAHVAALGAAGVTGIEALVLHAATGQVPAGVLRSSRAWSKEQWQEAIDGLTVRGLVQPDGTFTDAGQAFRADIEDRTNAAAQALVDAIGDTDTITLIELLKPLRAGLIDSGIFTNALGGTGRDEQQ